MEYSYIKDLSDSTDGWDLKIKIFRMLESTNPKKDDELISIDMVFIDEQVYVYLYESVLVVIFFF